MHSLQYEAHCSYSSSPYSLAARVPRLCLSVRGFQQQLCDICKILHASRAAPEGPQVSMRAAEAPEQRLQALLCCMRDLNSTDAEC